jgi:hypothetical protein
MLMNRWDAAGPLRRLVVVKRDKLLMLLLMR